MRKIFISILLILFMVLPIDNITYINNNLDQSLFEVSEYSGVIKSVYYNSYDYEHNIPSLKHMLIYLPYNYNENQLYNVIFALPGIYEDESFIFKPNYYKGQKVEIKNLLDNMMQSNLCEPFIFICINCFYGANPSYDLFSKNNNQVANELRNILIPYIQSNYSVYTDRSHYGLIGFSYGSSLAFDAGIGQNLDIIANFGCISGYTGIENLSFKDQYKINHLYIGCGAADVSKNESLIGYNLLINQEIVEQSNTRLNIDEKVGHDWTTFVNAIYNCGNFFFENLNLVKIFDIINT